MRQAACASAAPMKDLPMPVGPVMSTFRCCGYGITADLQVSLPDLERADAQRLVDAAHQICPYSNAARGNVDVGLSLT